MVAIVLLEEWSQLICVELKVVRVAEVIGGSLHQINFELCRINANSQELKVQSVIPRSQGTRDKSAYLGENAGHFFVTL